MKKLLVGLFISAALVFVAAPQSPTALSGQHQSDDQWPFKDETNQSYNLSSGARVEVSGINGKVEISPGGGAAQVHIIECVGGQWSSRRWRHRWTGRRSRRQWQG